MQMSDKVFAWTAPDIKYQPLYFEDVRLERYGQTAGPVKEVVQSAAHFLGCSLILPLNMMHEPAQSCDTPLGYCRPGNVNPYITKRLWYGAPLQLGRFSE